MKARPLAPDLHGHPRFALPSLEALLAAGEEVLAVVTQPDRPRAGGSGVSLAPVKELALSWNLPVLQPQRLKDSALVQQLAELRPDVDHRRGLWTHPCPRRFLALPSWVR